MDKISSSITNGDFSKGATGWGNNEEHSDANKKKTPTMLRLKKSGSFINLQYPLRQQAELNEEIEKLKQENEDLREALKHRGAYYWDENEQSFVCDFCGTYGSDEHAEDCEYIKLIGANGQ